LPGTNSFGECFQPGSVPPTYNSAFSNLFNSSAPDKGIGVNLSVPIRNRAAQANQVRGELEYRQQQVALQQTENTITLQVRQAQFTLQNNYAALQAALAARDYAQQSLDAEQKKFSYGASTPTLVLQASSNLTTAESNVLNSAANYEKSKVLLDYYTAETLTKLGIDVADAESGKVKHKPTVQGVVPADVQKSRSHPPAFFKFRRGLAVQLAANGPEGSDQSGSQQQQGGWLGGGWSSASENVESALVRDATVIPRAAISTTVLASASGEVQLAGSAIAEVPSSPERAAEVGWGP
jgi:hypothetical protein